MSTTITDVTELQAMEDDVDEDYVLGNNIDASATSGWNSGAGFVPVGQHGRVVYSRPESDDFGYAQQSGSWTIYPSDGVYYDKVDEVTSDDDSTYIQAVTSGSYCLLAHDATTLDIPDDAEGITVRIRARVRNVASGTSSIQGMLNINGTEYLVGSNLAVSSQSYALKTWSMTADPSTDFDWTAGSVFGLAVQGVGVKVSDASPDLRITQLYIEVDYSLKFRGTFDGAGYTISDLYIDRATEDYIGLFGYTDGATITDAILTGIDITGDDWVGGLIGYSNDSTISDSSIAGDVGVGSASYYVGGFVGGTEGSTFTSCSSTATVNGSTTAFDVGGFVGTESAVTANTFTSCYASGNVTGDSELGGFVGQVYGRDSAYTNCYATGSVASAGSGGDYLGGFTGGYTVVSATAFSKCYASGDITSTNGTWAMGGFAGDFSDAFTVSNCYARGDVTASNASAVGGFIGYSKDVVFTNCYSTGTPSGNANIGGFCGSNSGSTFTACFWDTITSGQASSDGGTGKTTAEMKTLATFTDGGWDIGGSGVNRNDGYPFLRWESGGAVPIWQIWQDPDVIGKRSWTIPDLKDYKGRAVKNARVRAYRVDTHALVETEITDANGSATFTDLPNDVDVTFHATWGG